MKIERKNGAKLEIQRTDSGVKLSAIGRDGTGYGRMVGWDEPHLFRGVRLAVQKWRGRVARGEM